MARTLARRVAPGMFGDETTATAPHQPFRHRGSLRMSYASPFVLAKGTTTGLRKTRSQANRRRLIAKNLCGGRLKVANRLRHRLAANPIKSAFGHVSDAAHPVKYSESSALILRRTAMDVCATQAGQRHRHARGPRSSTEPIVAGAKKAA